MNFSKTLKVGYLAAIFFNTLSGDVCVWNITDKKQPCALQPFRKLTYVDVVVFFFFSPNKYTT